MRRIGCLVAAAALAAFAGVAAPSAATAAGSGFIGTWESTDTDGSHQVQTITGSPGGSLTLRYYDDSANVCGGPPARFAGHGSTQDDTLVVTGVLVCVPGGNIFGRISLEVTYVPGADVLTDPSGVLWTRQ